MDQYFGYIKNEEFSHDVHTRSFLTYYEYYEPEKFKRLGGRLLRSNKSDREILNKIGYNRQFWENNPIVLRTPVEEEIIASLEAVARGWNREPTPFVWGGKRSLRRDS